MEFDLATALGPGSKKPEGACQVGDPKHCPLKAPGRPEAGAAHKPRHGSGSSSDSSSSSSDSEAEGKEYPAGCKKHERSSDKTKKPKVKEKKKEKKTEKKTEKKKEKKKEKAPH